MVRRGLTLIELLVTITMVTLLLGVLLPVFVEGTRRAAGGEDCRRSLRAVVRGLEQFTVDSGSYPPSYVYGQDTTGIDWDLNDQLPSSPNPMTGYVHWSGVLLAGGYVQREASFTCGEMPSGGAPRANPGVNPADWEPGQFNNLGAGAGAAAPTDRQARRMAFAANAALMPRNKLLPSGALRWSELQSRGVVPGTEPFGSPKLSLEAGAMDAGRTILFAELRYLPGARPWSLLQGFDGVIRSHRPITPFMAASAGTDVYQEPSFGSTPRFGYPCATALFSDQTLQGASVVNGGISELNLVGRHHAGGTANFAFVDGHIEPATVDRTRSERLWGERFYSISGPDSVGANCFGP